MARARRPLDDYRGKRDFGRTPEPAGGAGPSSAGATRFVVHRHEARNLHYDLRLEHEGALLSFAVPKGFSDRPADKRLAVRTEDHPLEYLTFAGRIPEGEYGAGAMTVWDEGTVRWLPDDDAAAALREGELKLLLDGRRLRGEWHLVRTKPDERHWLLFKSKDRYVGPGRDAARRVDLSAAPRAPLPKRVRRAEPAETVAPFTDPERLYELDLDGRRVLVETDLPPDGPATRGATAARIGGGPRGASSREASAARGASSREASAARGATGVRFRGLRGGRAALAPVVDALALLRARRALLDGVLVVQGPDDRPDRALLDEVLAGRASGDLLLYLFDVLHDDGLDLRPLPLRDRKAVLRDMLPEDPGPLLFLDHVVGAGEELARATAAAGLPGLVAKRADAPWRGGPTDDWSRVRVPSADATSRGSVRERLRLDADARPAPRVSNPDKLLWPEDGVTKQDLVDWYAGVADVLLPYLADRPVHMDRRPDGIHGKAFYQRHVTESLPDLLATVEIAGRDDPAPKPHFVCGDVASLLALANLASIDLHPWHSRVGSLESPDWAVIDLDPKGAPFAHVVRLAKDVGRLLRGIGLRPLLKTSGKTGLHVYVPLAEGYGYETVRMFCEAVARLVARSRPEIATVERSLAARGGRVYVDFGQNRRGATVVPPYVPRPVPGATVSAPLAWDELETDLTPADFTIRTMPDRLAERGDLFAPLLTDRQELEPALARLEEVVRDG